ncbi:radical SAM protein [archaeon]|nr:radical SAM protein [archaeon]MBT4373651.1 radical SAM protein [archaeon]MBT4531705.1 radical SAM protein [archaeon]MBT7001817.1 radical SAM protein [archaeon]MBT7281802.1 radical SAM protein [archaeon]
MRLKLFGEDLKKLFILNGWEETSLETADYIFINSCSFLKSKEDFFIKKIGGYDFSKKRSQKIFVFGCLSSSNPSRIEAINKEIVLFGRGLEQFVEYFKFKKTDFSCSYTSVEKLSFYKQFLSFMNFFLWQNPNIDYRLKRDKIFHLKISEGCLGNCSYCSEKFTTKLKSRKINNLIFEFKEGIKRGFSIFCFNSDDTSVFGRDNDENIYDLLAGVLNLNGDFLLAVTEFNPGGLLDERAVDLLTSSKICYITLPIQSGSQKILDKMNRCYNINEIIDKILLIKKLNPLVKINTHLIVGFPGETDFDFDKTLSLVKSGVFDRVKIFKYSNRPFTKASKFIGKISEEIKDKRVRMIKKAILLNIIKKGSFPDFILNFGGI